MCKFHNPYNIHMKPKTAFARYRYVLFGILTQQIYSTLPPFLSIKAFLLSSKYNLVMTTLEG
mgnify:CR=1 FL=1